jgi:hypothetical protein
MENKKYKSEPQFLVFTNLALTRTAMLYGFVGLQEMLLIKQ